MIRTALSFLASFVLFYMESLVVMKLEGYPNGIYFTDYKGVAVVFALNFILAFCLLTQLTPWFMRINNLSTEDDETTASS